MLDDKISAPKKVWNILNISWAIFFIFLGIANYIIYKHCSQTAWVYFKFLGTLGLMLIFIIIQSIFLGKYISESPSANKDSNQAEKPTKSENMKDNIDPNVID